MTERTALILDVDTGIDDSLALLYAAASPDAEFVAATCVSGNIDARQVAINTRAVLELAGRTDIEVALGRETPLMRPLETTPETHGPQGLGHAELPPPSRPLSDRHGVDVILEEARRRPGEITLVTLGPLTNLAIAVLREPALPRLLRAYTLMGGAFGTSGNTTPTTEWNIHCDPEAAKIVFRAWGEACAADPTIPRPLALGLDVTEQARIVPDDVVRLARRAGSTPDDSIALARGEDPMQATRSVASNPIVRYVADALRFYMEFHAQYDGFYGAFIHDPLAVAAALDRSLVTTEALYVDVETRGEITAGMTVADRRRLTGKPPNLDVAVSADVATFLDRLVERVGGLAADRPDVSG
jgi:purine nucleosidase